MPEESAFNVAKTRTPKGEARVREKMTMSAMGTLTAIGNLEEFNEALADYGIRPGGPRYSEALSAWNESRALKPPPVQRKQQGSRS